MKKITSKAETCLTCEDTPEEKKSARKSLHSSRERNPDHTASKNRINRIKGQLDAVSRMIDNREYCPNIIQQIRAATSALKGLEAEVLNLHLRGCVKNAFVADNPNDVNEKIEEILLLLKR